MMKRFTGYGSVFGLGKLLILALLVWGAIKDTYGCK